MVKTLIVGILLGIAVTAAVLNSLPLVDQHREVSFVEVAPNGGNRETFHINIPMDRVMVGAPGLQSGLPVGMDWPEDEILSVVSAELFKIRNERDVVVGVAARTVAKEQNAHVIDWLIHIPARGTLFVNMGPKASDDEFRIGQLRAGSLEFEQLTGLVTERWIANASGEEDAPEGRIELLATYVGKAGQPASVQSARVVE